MKTAYLVNTHTGEALTAAEFFEQYGPFEPWDDSYLKDWIIVSNEEPEKSNPTADQAA